MAQDRLLQLESNKRVATGSLAEILGPQMILRYNLFPAASITGEAAPG